MSIQKQCFSDQKLILKSNQHQFNWNQAFLNSAIILPECNILIIYIVDLDSFNHGLITGSIFQLIVMAYPIKNVWGWGIDGSDTDVVAVYLIKK